jgi:hypothetical protein
VVSEETITRDGAEKNDGSLTIQAATPWYGISRRRRFEERGAVDRGQG